MIKVCDAIMGSGKSQSAIEYMNSHPETKFVYITPYLDEASRIAQACKGLSFVEPCDKLPEFHFKKLEHTRHLLLGGYNIATTHSAFRAYTMDMVEAIKKYEYTLIIDEAVDVFQEVKCSDGDIQLLIDAGYITESHGEYQHTGKEYTGTRLSDLCDMFKSNNLVVVDDGKRGPQYYYWAVPYDILCAFSDVFVLTYLFESSEFKYFLDIHRLDYINIGIRRNDDQYQFVDEPEYIPDYVSDIKNYLHIFYNDKLNRIGKNKNALSVNWLTTHKAERETLKKNIYTFFRYHMKAKNDQIMWSTYNKKVHYLRGRGYSKQNVEFNKKASNDYRDRTVLAYCVNLFPPPQKVHFFGKYGINYDSDGSALSTMVQWIWRSGIRDGRPIYIYIPSRRMRELLEAWLDNLVHYNTI